MAKYQDKKNMKSKTDKKKQKVELEQTQGTVRLMGYINRLEDNGIFEGNIKNGAHAGNEYKSLRFGIKTSETNEVPVELFGMEFNEVKVYEALTKEERENGQVADEVTLEWEDRDEIPDGYQLPFFQQITLSLERDAKGKLIRNQFLAFDAVEEIFEKLEDGDCVYLRGNIEHSEYVGQDQKKHKQSKFVIKSISKTKKEVDFLEDDFTEIANFEQQLVYIDSMMDNETNKLHVIGRTINYKGEFTDIMFAVDNEKYPKLVKNIKKMLKFGDLVTVFGNCVNRTVEQIQEVESDEEFDFGGEKPKSYQRTINRTETELEIVDIDGKTFKLGQGKYKIEDFKNVNLIQDKEDDDEKDDEEDDENVDFGGKGNSDSDIDIEDDDLPF
jgi:hypothetical protein